jgi:membrane-associated phospholipid phosphatase
MIVSVLLSTLFTHQHYLPDLIGGLALAKNSIHLGNWWVQKRSPLRQRQNEPIRSS